jgi:phage host-nuclease inhibitor protein Gam
MAREKKVIHTGVTQEQMDTAFSEYATADAQLKKINASIDLQVTKIRDKYAEEIGKLAGTKTKTFDIIQSFAMENPELFAKKKSLETVHGVIGFRTGNPQLKLLRGFTWPAVTNLLREFLPGYVRTIEEPAKDKLLNDRDEPEVVGYFQRVGLSVVQNETFYVEPKTEGE